MQKCGIYLISIDLGDAGNMYYVGQSVDCSRRCTEHRSKLKHGKHANLYMQRIYNIHGAECFKYEVLEECSPSFLDELEQWWLNEIRGHWRTLNLAWEAASPRRGVKVSQATKEKMSGSKMGRPGTKWSPERRAAFSAARKGSGNPFFGKKWSDKQRSEHNKKNSGDAHWTKRKT